MTAVFAELADSDHQVGAVGFICSSAQSMCLCRSGSLMSSSIFLSALGAPAITSANVRPCPSSESSGSRPRVTLGESARARRSRPGSSGAGPPRWFEETPRR